MPDEQDSVRSGALPGSIDPIAALRSVPGAVALIDESGTVLWVSEPLGELSGYQSTDLIGTNILEHLHPDRNEAALVSIGYAMDTPGRRLPTVLCFVRRDGSALYLETSANNQLHNPAIGALVVHLQPCGERQLLDHVLEGFVAGGGLGRTIARIQAVADAETLDSGSALVLLHHGTGSGDDLLASDAETGVLTQSRSDATPWMAAARDDEVVHRRLEGLPTESMRREAGALGYSSCWCFPVSRSGTDFVDAVLVFWRRQVEPPEPNATMMAAKLVKLCELVLERVAHSRQLEHAASHDPLTGLVNRSAFFTAVDRHLSGDPGDVGVLYLDLDRFKPINDELGHGLGDVVLHEVAQRLEAAVRPTDTVARLGGDEFAVVCPATSAENLDRLAKRLIAVVGESIEVDGVTMTVGVSIGSALCASDACSADQLVAEADARLLEVKATDKGSWKAATLSG